MDDDVNTSPALAALDDLVHRINEYAHGIAGGEPLPATAGALREALAVLDELTGVLGIALEDPDAPAGLDTQTHTAIEVLVAQRALARANREWAEADRIRRELDEKYNVVVKDTPQGATWSVRE
jgi:cysteinyl-tRNA synthetase